MKKGEKGIRILAPIVGIRRKKDEEAEKDITKQNTRVLVGFRNAYVFDVSQTEGAELPSLHEITGDAARTATVWSPSSKRQGIELVFTEKIAPALGMSYGGRIAILPGQSKAEEFSAPLSMNCARDVAQGRAPHRHHQNSAGDGGRGHRLCGRQGRRTGDRDSASADYIQLYHGNASLLAESLEVIQQTSGVILAALEPPTAARGRDARCRTGEGGVMQTILRILKQAGGWHHGLYLKIENPPYMALVIEATDESGPCGLPAISVATTANRTATPCATRRCVSSLASRTGHI